jgi:hypothetical protein
LLILGGEVGIQRQKHGDFTISPDKKLGFLVQPLFKIVAHENTLLKVELHP